MARIKSGGSASSGRSVSKKARKEKSRPVLLTNRPMFVYLYHPKRYTVIDGAVVPQLKELRFVEDRNVNPEDELTKWRKLGWVDIPWDVRGDGTDYIRAHDGPGKTTVYLSEFEQPHRGSSAVVSDTAGYVAFLVWLEENGKIPEPELHILEGLRDRAQGRFDDYAARSHANPKVQAVADRCAVDLQALSDKIESLLSPATASKPKKVKKPKKGSDEPQDV